MPPTSPPATPGVYINEFDAFPPSVVGVATAVPAFIGYTEKASLGGTSRFFDPVQITSMHDFENVFGAPAPLLFRFEAVAAKSPCDLTVDETSYVLVQQSQTFHLYRSMELFFANGGGSCYVISVGDYSGGITAKYLSGGVNSAANEMGITLLVVPDACLLATSDDFASVTQAALEQCQRLGDRFAILDVWGEGALNKANLADQLDPVATAFKGTTGDIGLSYGAAYFPLLDTSISSLADVDFTWFNPTQLGPLPPPSPTFTVRMAMLPYLLSQVAAEMYPIGSPELGAAGVAIAELSTFVPGDTPAAIQAERDLNQRLGKAIPPYVQWQTILLGRANVLPASAAMAGVYTYVDSTQGVWLAPANVALRSTISPSVVLNDDQQGTLNVPVDGKAIDVIRYFPGRGTVVWGARTLDGNSNDWRYVQVRRTVIYIESSIKNALKNFVFATNNGETWITVTAMISNFLNGLWKQGGLMGDKASDAYSVQCGLGSTMTAQDILNGVMVVQVTLQMVRPGEFIELTFTQQLATSA